ncbi:DUF6916 family protein [Marinisporobacter balticus]|uniref:DUF6916 domain-containing protein n=1 Tax=Marinisporobacter balticus TaxID=2018667 RepID=A0A4R2KHN7_9FIRM|nr:hypothetical protein [Marinisporobacter balticus]TCO70009.1 hypothetical protein EV214_1284 [Marinisporobacter balticus]
MIDLQTLAKAHFEEHLHTYFKMHVAEDVCVDLELIESEDHSNDHIDSFSLIFKAPLKHAFPQGTYKLEHLKVGTLHLFLVPIKKDADGLYYQAISTRLKKS